MRREIARHAEFTAAVGQIAEVSEKICEARPWPERGRPRCRRVKGGALRRARGSQVRRDSTAGGGSGPGAGLRRRARGRRDGAPRRAAEARRQHARAAAVRRPRPARPAAALRPGPRAEFTDYRDKVIDTVLGPVTLRRAWYHCADAGTGSRRAMPGSASSTSLSPGLAAMNDIAAAAGPFAKAACCWKTWPGLAERQARRARRRGQRRRAVRRGPRAIRGDRRPQAGPMPPSPSRTCSTARSTALA